jgi:hypothetical protein
MAHTSIRRGVFAVIGVACLTSQTAAQPIPEDFVIKLERTACFGACPVYAVTIDAKGNVIYDGTRFVRIVGRQTDRIPVSQVAALVATVDRIGFFELDDKYRQLITDLPTTFVTVTRRGRTKAIEDYFGAPKALKDLERQIDEAARTARWIVGQPSMKLAIPGEDLKRGGLQVETFVAGLALRQLSPQEVSGLRCRGVVGPTLTPL